MSGSIGGASFDLGVSRERFGTELAAAITQAEQAARSIQSILSGAGAVQTGGTAQAAQGITAVGNAAQQTDSNITALTSTVRQAEGEWERLNAAVQQAAQAQTQAAATGTNAQIKLAAASEAVGLAAKNAAAATQAATDAANRARETQAAVTVATGRVIVDQFEAEQRAQRAVNTLRTAFNRQEDRSSGGSIETSLESSERALQRIQGRDFTGAFRELTVAERDARNGLAEINQQLSILAGSNPAISRIQELDRTLEAFRARRDADPDSNEPFPEAASRERNLLQNNLGPLEAKQFAELNVQAKTLTTALDQLAATQREAAGQGAAGAREAREQASRIADATRAARQQVAAIEDQEKAQQKLTQTQRAQTVAQRAEATEQAKIQKQQAVEQAQASARSLVTTATQAAINADPSILNAVESQETLLKIGLNAKEAGQAVNGLQTALTSLGKVQAIKELQVGLQSNEQAALALGAAVKALASGDKDAAIVALEAGLKGVRTSLVEANTAAQQLDRSFKSLSGNERVAAQQELARLNAARSALTASQAGIEKSLSGVEGPDLRRLRQEEIDQKKEINRIDQEAASNRRALAREATAAQNLLGASGQGALGRVVGGLGRGAASLDSAGITASTVAALGLTAGLTALGAAIAATTRIGFDFNATMEVTAVRLTAATGSAAEANKEVARLKTLSVSQQFGDFGTADLAAGLEKLSRIGQNTPARIQQIADVAAATGQTFEQTATQIGVFYERLNSGLPLDDTLQGLINAGVLTAEYAAQLRYASIAGATAAEKTQIFEASLNRFASTSERITNTSTGSIQRLKNEFGILAGAATGAGFSNLSNAIGDLADTLADPRLVQGAAVLGRIAAAVFFTAPTAGIALADKIRDVLGAVSGRTAQDDAKKSADDAARAALTAQSAAGATLLKDRAEQQRLAYVAGQAAVRAYVSGFDDAAATAFATLDDAIRTHLEALSGGKLSGALEQQFSSVIEPLIARAVQEVQQYGKVGEDTATGIAAALGVEGDEVLKLIDLYGKLREATAAVERAKAAVSAAQINVDYGQQIATDILHLDQNAIDAAEKIKKAHEDAFDTIIDQQREVALRWSIIGQRAHETFQSQIDDLDKEIKARGRANQDAAEQAQDAIQSLQDGLTGYQDTVDQRRQQAQDALDAMRKNVQAIQAEVQQAQTAQSVHQAAYQAVLAGTIDLFNQEHQQQDDITRAIITKWDAEISGARRAKDEADQRVRAQTEAEHLLTLAYDKRIAAARAAHREDQARALERERDRVLAAQRQAGQVDRDEAAVAADRLEDRTRDAQDEAKRTGSSDQIAVNTAQARADAAQKELDAAQELEKQRQRAEEEEIKRRQAAIEAAQRAEQARARAAAHELRDLTERRDQIVEAQKESDKYYKDIIDHIEKEVIPALQKQKKEQQIADQQKIDDAKAVYAFDKEYFDQRKRGDQAILDNAKLILEQANLAVTAYEAQINSLKTVNGQLDQMLLKAQAYLNALRLAAGLQPLPLGLPGDGYPQDPVQPGAGRGSAPNPSGASFPVAGYTGPVTPHGGTNRGGADLFADEGTSVVALADGVITDVSYNSLGGNTVTLRTDSGLYVYMAHLRDRAAVTAGQRVKAGQFLGYVGSTGNAAGGPPHLHIGIATSPGGFVQGGGAAGGTGNADATGILGAIQSGQGVPPQAAPQPGAAKPPLLTVGINTTPPPGYTGPVEATDGFSYFVPQGYTLADYGKTAGSSSTIPADPAPAQPAAPGVGQGGGGPKNSIAGDFDYQKMTVPLPRVPSDYPSINIDALARAHAFAGYSGHALDVATGGGAQRNMHIAGSLVHIDTVNASDPRDVDNLIRRIKDEAFGEHAQGLDTAMRGDVIDWGRRL